MKVVSEIRIRPDPITDIMPTPTKPALRTCILPLVPGGLLAAAAVVLLQFWTLPPEVHAVLPLFPALVLAIGLLLGAFFNRTRLVYALAVLAVADLCLKTGGDAAPLAHTAVGSLLPLNLLLIASYAERGLFTPIGVLRLTLIGAQPGIVLLLNQVYPRLPEALLNTPLFLWPHPLFPGVPHPALAAATLCALFLLLRCVRRPSAMEGGFFWFLGCAVAPILLGAGGDAVTLWFGVGGVILIVALLQSSHAMAFRDELTGLPSRRALNEHLLKMGRRYAVAMVDVDHFKQVNDTYGHDVGDQVLKMVASRLRKVNGGGRPFRYGGEEFTILFPGRTAEEALPHLEELREIVGGAPFILRHPGRPKKKPASAGKKGGVGKISITVSIGVAERRDGCNAEAILKRADQALYAAKRGGRNRVCLQGVGKG